MKFDDMLPALGQCDGNADPYGRREHAWGDWSTHEERGVLVVTAGRRQGRIFTVERSWRERTCAKCGMIDRRIDQSESGEWPRL